MFGSDYPFIQPDRWLHDFSNLEIREPVIPKVLIENARRALNIPA
jgi:predicted TIM-barrel fold metal-dependent hydrolase